MQDLSDLGRTQGADVIQGEDDPLLLRQTGEQLLQSLRGHGSKVTDMWLTDAGLQTPVQCLFNRSAPMEQFPLAGLHKTLCLEVIKEFSKRIV